MKIHRLSWLCVWLCALAAGGEGAAPLEPVTLLLQWQHQAQFAGYYMALARGYYEREGLEVRIRRGGPDVRTTELLLAGEVDFRTMMLSTALDERAAGGPLVHLAQIVNRSNFLVVAWRNPATGNPIRELADLDGRRITVWEADFRAPYLAVFAKHGVRPDILPQYNTFSLFLHRGADAFVGMRYNEYNTLLQSGIAEEEVQAFALRDHGANLPEDGIYCLETTWQRRPQVCRAFARASLEGWRYAQARPEETLDVVMEYVNRDNLPTNRAHMRWMLKEMVASIFPGPDDDWTEGRLSPAAYARTVEILTRHAGLREAPRYETLVVEGGVDETR